MQCVLVCRRFATEAPYGSTPYHLVQMGYLVQGYNADENGIRLPQRPAAH